MSSHFGSQINASIKKFADDATKKHITSVARDVRISRQSAFDGVYNQCTGKPIETVLPHVREAMRKVAMPGDEVQARKFAQTISAGNRVTVSVTQGPLPRF